MPHRTAARLAHLPRSTRCGAAALALVALAACSGSSPKPGATSTRPTGPSSAGSPQSGGATGSPQPGGSIPPVLDPRDIYSAGRPGLLSPEARLARPLVYVPDSVDNTVHVIDPRTYKILQVVKVGSLPQHITPSWDLKTLWVDNDMGNSLTPINPRTGVFGRPVQVADPYNLYFTADGRFAVVVAEKLRRLDFRDAHTMRLVHSLHLPCPGLDHMDFSTDGRFALASCEFGAKMVYVDMQNQALVSSITLDSGSMPQDVKLSPDGRVFYVADMAHAGVYVIDAQSLRVLGRIPTGSNAHGLYISRDSKTLYVSNRVGHSVSLIDLATRRVRDVWSIPGGSPDMGGLNADGTVLWLSGRYTREVYAIDTRNGKLLARIPVGAGPHGLCIWPQPGRYSLGHTGILR